MSEISSKDIRIIQPSVYIVGRQTVDDAELSRFLQADALEETARRVAEAVG